MIIRRLTADDVPTVTQMLNDAIHAGESTRFLSGCEEPQCAEWILTENRDDERALVCETDRGLIGWGWIGRFYPRAAWAPSYEITVCVSRPHRRHGVGGRLMTDLLEAGRGLGAGVALAVVWTRHDFIIDGLGRRGFHRAGTLRGLDEGPYACGDLAIMELALRDHGRMP